MDVLCRDGSIWQTAADGAWNTYESAVATAETAWDTTEAAAWTVYGTAVAGAETTWNITEANASVAYDDAMATAEAARTGAEATAWAVLQTSGESSSSRSRYLLTVYSPPTRDRGVPLVAFNRIGAGFPTTLPPVGQVTVVVAHGGAHTFLILLNANGQMSYFRGGPVGSGILDSLEVNMGGYGTGDEVYLPKITAYHPVGDVEEGKLERLTALMANLNAANQSYGSNANNCNSTTCQGLEAMGMSVPDSPVPDPPRSAPGWGTTLR